MTGFPELLLNGCCLVGTSGATGELLVALVILGDGTPLDKEYYCFT